MRGCVLSILFLALALWGLSLTSLNNNNISLLNKEKIVESGSDYINVSAGGEFIWNFTFSSLFNRTIVYFRNVDFKMDNTSFTSFLALTPQNYEKYLELRTCKTCPAPFLNRKTIMYTVIYDNKDIEDILKSCKSGDYLSIYGNYLNVKITSSKSRKVRFSMPPRSHFLYINSIKKL